MSIEIKGKVYRNLQEQVEKNKEDIELIGLKHWVNCNTRDDYRFIVEYWRKWLWKI